MDNAVEWMIVVISLGRMDVLKMLLMLMVSSSSLPVPLSPLRLIDRGLLGSAAGPPPHPPPNEHCSS